MRKIFPGSIAPITVLAMLALAGTAAAQRYPGYGWCMMNSWAGGFIMWILILLVIVLVVSLFIRTSRRAPAAYEPGRETPLEIIKKRYARGEISKAEFEEMKKDLSS
ncbi:MAG: SHOCT domain-containing protein [Desulfomonilia bacterium]|jgi:putative membrane protein